jgi:hypothetical protein
MTEMQPPYSLCLLSGIIAIANAIPDMGAMTSLNLANNNLGELVIPITLPAGWEEGKNQGDGRRIFRKPGGEWAFDGPPKAPLGAIAIANAIKDMGALTSLNLSSNKLMAEGAKIVAEAIKVWHN